MPNKKIIHYRPTIAKVNLTNLKNNLRIVRRLVGRSVMLMPTVKANAYGHGLIKVAKVLDRLGVDFLGVSSLEEAIVLREAGIKRSILVLGVIFNKNSGVVLDYKLRQTVFSYDLAKALDTQARKRKTKAVVHIKVDTGMGRLGVLYKDSFNFIKKIKRFKNLKIEGIFTHFPKAETDISFTRQQIKAFKKLIEKLSDCGINIPIVHSANSMGIIDYKTSHFNLVRPGLMLYGIYPKKGVNLGLKPVMSLVTKVGFIKQLPIGHGVSYGHSFVARAKTKVAILPIGYGDGYFRAFSDKAYVLIRGKRCKIIGKICMDYTMVDITHIGKVNCGDEVVLIGSQRKEQILALQLAELINTIAYEITCSVGERVPRVFI
ncbi:MAG: alanine racemase [Candidatus Gygaella obscura]|nr:alanine racemase [Candidatus Gygaella obscura]